MYPKILVHRPSSYISRVGCYIYLKMFYLLFSMSSKFLSSCRCFVNLVNISDNAPYTENRVLVGLRFIIGMFIFIGSGFFHCTWQTRPIRPRKGASDKIANNTENKNNTIQSKSHRTHQTNLVKFASVW